MARKTSRARVFFPWERKRGIFGLLGRTRARLVLGVVLTILFIVLVRRREEHAAAVRATRASMTTAGRAVTSYRADHSGSCPREMAELVAGGYAHDVPTDAWGRPFRIACPGRRDTLGFDIWSDGPDGLPAGLDRVE